jgi:hypothetical protein
MFPTKETTLPSLKERKKTVRENSNSRRNKEGKKEAHTAEI